MISPQPKQTTPLPAIKGSWEDLLAQAQQYAVQQNDEAIPLFRKLVERLGRLPAAQRTAADGRLERILLHAAFDLQAYLCGRELYAQALASHQELQPLLPAVAQQDWAKMAAAIHLQAGAVDDALAAMTRVAEQGGLDEWGDLLFASLAYRRVPVAEQAVLAAEGWVNRTYALRLDDAPAKRDQAFVAYMKARLALANGTPEQSLAWFEHAMLLDEFYRTNPQYLYTQLVDAGEYRAAQTLIRQDQQNPVRAGFWQGVVLWRSGQRTEAERQFRKVIQIEPPADGEVDLLELTLTHYFLGDREGTGLGRVLNATREEGGFWGWFYLAGLGWALRGDMKTARADLQLAALRRRSRFEGRRLAASWWQFCVDLLDEPTRSQLKEFFDDATL